jgi:hypothetical protein
MDKPDSSRNQFLVSFATVILLAVGTHDAPVISLSRSDTLKIGKRIWQNECNGTIAGLTAWNEGENFASIGIGHFIWYPKGQRGPFEESFPKLVGFMKARGVKLPALVEGAGEQPCPWNSRGEFGRAQHLEQMKQLRQFLADTIDVQAEFLIARLQSSLPKMLAEAAPADRPNVERQFERMTQTPQGFYALVDYVNFKGEGVLHTERYQGQGWGLLQVLEQMPADKGDPLKEFSRAAVVVLKRRVASAPPERGEARWLPGWLNRVRGYSRG